MNVETNQTDYAIILDVLYFLFIDNPEKGVYISNQHNIYDSPDCYRVRLHSNRTEVKKDLKYDSRIIPTYINMLPNLEIAEIITNDGDDFKLKISEKGKVIIELLKADKLYNLYNTIFRNFDISEQIFLELIDEEIYKATK